MTAHIVTPLTVRDAEIVAAGAVGMPGEFSRAGVIERVTALVMRVDVASREQAWADRGGPELLAALKVAERILADPDVPDNFIEPGDPVLVWRAAIARAEGR